MAALISPYIHNTLGRLGLDELVPAVLKRQPFAVLLSTFLVACSPWLYSNYLEFLALGPGGMPYNARGWLMALFFKLFERNTTSTAEYDHDANTDRWLDTSAAPLPLRHGPRPYSGFHVVPVRQFDQLPSDEMGKRLDAMVQRIIAANTRLVVVRKSPHERRNDALVVHPDVPSPHALAELVFREIAHVHPSDHSLHVLLAPQDCKTVITRGWGERHKVAGSSGLWLLPLSINRYLPKEYIWLYAPRDEKELAVVEKILLASIAYMTGQRASKGDGAP